VYTNVTFNWVHGTRNWNIVLEGKQVGVSTLNGDSVGHGIEAGAEEAISNTAAIWAHMKNWQYDNGSGWLPVGGVTPIHTTNSNMSLSALGSSGGRPQFSVSTPSAPCGKTPAIVQHGTFANLDETTAAQVALTDARLNGSRAAVSSIKVVSTTRAQAVSFDNGDRIIRETQMPEFSSLSFVGIFPNGSTRRQERVVIAPVRCIVSLSTKVTDSLLTPV